MGNTGWQQTVERARALSAEAMAITAAPMSGRRRAVTDGPANEGWSRAGERRLEVAWLAGAVEWLAEVAPSWTALTGEVATGRSYRQVLCVPALEIWLICWPRDGRLQLHDHGGASGAFQVVDGELEEWSLAARPPAGGSGAVGLPVGAGGAPDGAVGPPARAGDAAGGAPWRRRLIGPGEPVAFDGDYIHDVRNSECPVATSVHVYSAAQRPMAFYRVDGGLIRTVGRGEHESLLSAEIAAEGRGDLDAGWSETALQETVLRNVARR